jgi:large subunit ribosomal protein L15
LAAKGLIRDVLKPVVILGGGELSKKLSISAHRFTKSAQEKISKAGGSFEIIPQKVTGARVTVKLLSREKLAKLNAES